MHGIAKTFVAQAVLAADVDEALLGIDHITGQDETLYHTEGVAVHEYAILEQRLARFRRRLQITWRGWGCPRRSAIQADRIGSPPRPTSLLALTASNTWDGLIAQGFLQTRPARPAHGNLPGSRDRPRRRWTKPPKPPADWQPNRRRNAIQQHLWAYGRTAGAWRSKLTTKDRRSSVAQPRQRTGSTVNGHRGLFHRLNTSAGTTRRTASASSTAAGLSRTQDHLLADGMGVKHLVEFGDPVHPRRPASQRATAISL